MVIVNLKGGLGNQLFQYAFGYYLAKINCCELKIDISSYKNYELHSYSLPFFEVDEKLVTQRESDFFKGVGISFSERFIRKLFFSNYFINEETISFDKKYKLIKPPVYIDGYWQSEMYFNEIESEIRKLYRFSSIPDETNQSLLEIIRAENSISLHIRRGDYINIESVNKTHGILSLDYYNLAVKIISDKIENPKFYIFSDDIEWAKNNLKLNHYVYFVEVNIGKNDAEDLRLMSECKHHIIANSTFSWWGAWLNHSRDKIVIAPNKWFNDIELNNETQFLVPSEWLRI
jgi:hypothetical protein